MTSNISIFLVLILSISYASASSSIIESATEDFIRCLVLYSNNATSISQIIYTPRNSSFQSIWQFSINNIRFNSTSNPQPLVIVTPTNESHIRTVIYCAKNQGLELRIRGGGHDFEGLSYTNPTPLTFIMLDMINMRSIHVDATKRTTWVQGGATLGETYYRISQESPTLGFPGGTWSTVGVGGLIGGGGHGFMMRKYGLAADHVLDARLIDVNGRILNRKSMGEDLFWAIRGGGASSFGVILAWKLRLVTVPETVTLFTINATLETGATDLIYKWQYIAPTIDSNLRITATVGSEYIPGTRNKTIYVLFGGDYLGKIDTLLPLMEKSFPELGLTREHCTEMTWIQSVLVHSAFSHFEPPEILLNRSAVPKQGAEGKSDLIRRPIPIEGWESMWQMFFKSDLSEHIGMSPYGGIMDEFSESEIPFPNRKGTLFMILERVYIDANTPQCIRDKRIQWIREFYKFMAQYASKNPRRAYVNYNDLDIGVGSGSYEEASIWGIKYFNNNFRRLVDIKTNVDPLNFFRHPQSIPSFPNFSSDM